MLKVFLALFFFYSQLVLGQSVVDETLEDDPDNFAVTLYTVANANTFDIFEEAGSSNSSSSPHKIYIPVTTSSNTNENFSYFAARSNLPLFVGGDSNNNIEIRFQLDVDVNGSTDDLHVAVSDSATGTFYSADYIGAFTDGVISYDLDMQRICDRTELTFECDSFDNGVTADVQESIYLFFFLNNGEIGDGSTVTPSSFTGEFYEVNLSNKTHDSDTISLTGLTKGDEQLNATYSLFSFSNLTEQSLFSYVVTGTTVDSSNNTEDFNDLGISFSNLTDLETIEQSDTIPLINLVNGTSYSVRLFWCDRFGFCSFSSQALSNTPEDIEALLEKQACFFFTAGFGEEHYIVDYFQEWRDKVLSKYFFGRQFIKWYYSFAPQHTPFILERPWLQRTIQSTAYLLYGVIRYWYVCLFLLLVLVVQSLRMKMKNSLVGESC